MPDSPEIPESVQMAMEIMVTQIETTIVTAMEKTLIEMPNEDQRQWAHAVAGAIFNDLSHTGWSFALNLGKPT